MANVPHGELKRLQSDVDKLKVKRHELEFPISFEWKRLNDKPTNVRDSFNCSPVVLSGEVYLRGTSNIIHQYTPSSDAWTNLPESPTSWGGMAALSTKLIVVGNNTHGGIATWSNEMHKWVCSHSPLPTGRTFLTAVSYKNFVIVAGGVPSDKALQSTTTVEVLDADSGKWHKAPPMPYNGSVIISVVIGEHLYLHLKERESLTIYLMSKSILKVSLPTLISHTLAGKNRNTSIWEKLPDVPFYNSTVFSIGNMLLSAGGTPAGTAGALASAMKIKGYKVVSDIYLFNPFTNQWVKVGDLPEPRFDCICVTYSPDKLLLVGGSVNLDKKTSAIYTATINRFHF